MEKSDHDHISLTLCTVGATVAEEEAAARVPHRRQLPIRLRRSWNQLPRCQRNLIILGMLAMLVTLLFLLPGEQIVADEGRPPLAVRSIFPFNAKHESIAKVVDVNVAGAVYVGQPLNGEVPKQEAPLQLELSVNRKLPHEQPSETKKQVGQDHELNEVDAKSRKIHIQEVAIAKNDLEALVVDPITALNDGVHDPHVLPGTNGLTINDLLKRLEEKPLADADKQHFHGANNNRQSAVVTAFQHSWAGYKQFAWGHDNLKPISQSSHEWFGLGLTIIDSLDTMYIMGLEDEFTEARNWVEESLSLNVNRDVNLFEVTIRVLGGLLSSYHLSGDIMFLRKSIELGNRLLPCFLSPSGIPYSDVNLASMSAHSPKWSPDSSTSEVTTIQLEFRDLSRSINVPIYEQVVDAVNEKVHVLEKKHGLVPIFINANTGTFRNYATISLGARGDSYYEYLLKQWIQTGRKEGDVLIVDYLRAIDGVLTQLMRRTPKEGHVYLGELINGKDFKPKMDHLTCYLPGTLLLGHKYGMPDSHLLLAKDLLDTCYQTYVQQPTKLAPEISHFALNDNEPQEIYVKTNDAHNLLRPEFVESLYYFYALTGNRTYQDMGWSIFQAFEQHTRVPHGYSSIGNVKNPQNTRLRDMMESFWLGETLKYFYLLFSDNRNELDLEKWVLNTEAHPLPIWKT